MAFDLDALMNNSPEAIESRRIYSVGGHYYVVLTYAELQTAMVDTPHLVEIVNGDACIEVRLDRGAR